MKNTLLFVSKWHFTFPSHNPTFASPGVWSRAKEGLFKSDQFCSLGPQVDAGLPIHVIHPQIPSQTPADLWECLANIPSPWTSSQHPQIPRLPLRPTQLERVSQETPCPSCLDSSLIYLYVDMGNTTHVY